jgi:hypothetical protein
MATETMEAMAMQIRNRTHWRTADLKAILSKVARQELNDTDRQRYQRKHLRVDIVYSRGAHSGCAWLKSTRMRLRLPKAFVNAVEFAWLCEHELAHVRGQEHRQMAGDVMHFTERARARYAWAASMPIRTVEVKRAVRPAPDAKLAHAQRMLKVAETRRKRAVTLERKWVAKVRYYEKRSVEALQKAAGSSCGQEDSASIAP